MRQWWVDLRVRWVALFGRRQLQARAEEEVQFHLAMLEQRLIDAGATAADARERARRQFGNAALMRERTVDSWRYAPMATVVHDVRYGLRSLRNRPGFAATVIGILMTAIGASSAMFSVFDALVLRPLPYHHPEQLVRISEDFAGLDITGMQLADAELDDLLAMTSSFSHIAGIRTGEFALTEEGAAEGVAGLRVSASIFPLLGVTPLLGRPLLADDEESGKPRVVVLSEGLWRRRFGGDAGVIGRAIDINRERYIVVGVSRPFLDYLGAASDLWVPLTVPPGAKTPASRGAKGVDVIARLKPGIALSAAERDLAATTSRLSALYPQAYPARIRFSLHAVDLASTVTGSVRQPLLFLLAAVALVMLIACANVSNLLLAHGSARRKEISIRAAVGAGRARVIRQLMTESVLIALIAAGFGLVFAHLLLKLFERYGPHDLIPVAGLGLNASVAAFAIGVVSFASVACGLVPALTTSGHLNHALKDAARGSTTGGRFQASMVAIQVAASLVLLVSAGLLIQSFVRTQSASPGFNASSILTFDVLLPVSHYGEPERRIDFFQAFQSRLRALPGVLAVGAVDRIPFGGPQGGSPLRVVGRTRDANAPRSMVRPARVLPGYFEALGVPLRRGRTFTSADARDTAPVAIVDEAAARQFFPGEDPIGKQIADVEPGLTSTIVGVVGSMKRRDLTAAPEMGVYHAASQKVGAALTFTVKTTTEPLALIPAIRHELTALDPLLPLTRPATMEQRLSESLARRRLSVELMVFFGIAALLLAATGLYSVLSFVVAQRRREIGIRVALGARPTQLIELVVAKQGLVPVAIGIAAGLTGAVAAARLLAAGLYEVSPSDPAVYGGVTALLAMTALIAIAVPAQRAARLNPVTALRED
jgi:predicted permease